MTHALEWIGGVGGSGAVAAFTVQWLRKNVHFRTSGELHIAWGKVDVSNRQNDRPSTQ